MKSLSRRESNWTRVPVSRPDSVLWADTLLESGLVSGNDDAAGSLGRPSASRRGCAGGSSLTAARGRK